MPLNVNTNDAGTDPYSQLPEYVIQAIHDVLVRMNRLQ